MNGNDSTETKELKESIEPVDNNVEQSKGCGELPYDKKQEAETISHQSFFYETVFEYIRKYKALRVAVYIGVTITFIQSNFSFLTSPYIVNPIKYHAGVKPNQDTLAQYRAAFYAGQQIVKAGQLSRTMPPSSEYLMNDNMLRENASMLGNSLIELRPEKMQKLDPLERLFTYSSVRSEFAGAITRQSLSLGQYYNLGINIQALRNSVDNAASYKQSVYFLNIKWAFIVKNSKFKIKNSLLIDFSGNQQMNSEQRENLIYEAEKHVLSNLK